MEYVKLADGKLNVSRFCLGCMSFGDPASKMHAWTLNPEDSERIIKHALELGINFFDTANVYSAGTSEEYLGRAIKRNVARGDVYLASKVYFNDGNLSREAINREIDGTLKRLGTDYIDLYQVHYLDGVTPVDEMMEALLKHKRAGRIRAIGLSNVTPAQAAAFAPYGDDVASFQNHYSLAHRDDEAAMLETARLLEAAPLTWGSLGQGILTGKYGADVHFARDDRRSRAVYDNFYGNKLRRNLRIVDVMRPIAEAHGVSVAAVAVRWIVDHLPQSVVIAGMKSPAQAEANAVALTFRLTEEEVAALEAASREP